MMMMNPSEADRATDVVEKVAAAIWADEEARLPLHQTWQQVKEFGAPYDAYMGNARAAISALAEIAGSELTRMVDAYGEARTNAFLIDRQYGDFERHEFETIAANEKRDQARTQLLAIAAAPARTVGLNLTTSLPPEREVRARIMLAVDPQLNQDGAFAIVDRVVSELTSMGALKMATALKLPEESGEMV